METLRRATLYGATFTTTFGLSAALTATIVRSLPLGVFAAVLLLAAAVCWTLHSLTLLRIENLREHDITRSMIISSVDELVKELLLSEEKELADQYRAAHLDHAEAPTVQFGAALGRLRAIH